MADAIDVTMTIAINGGAPQQGGIVATVGQACQLSAVSKSGWGSPATRWEIYDYPPDFTVPAGWSTDSEGTFYVLGNDDPPSFVMDEWGKYMTRVVVRGKVTDERTAVSILSPTGLPSIARREGSQFGGARLKYVRDLKLLLHGLYEEVADAVAGTTPPNITNNVSITGPGALSVAPAAGFDYTAGVNASSGNPEARFGGSAGALVQLYAHGTPLTLSAGDVGIKAAARVLIEAPATTGTSGIDIRAGAATGSPGAGVVRMRGLNGVTIDSTAGVVSVAASATSLALGGAAVPVASTCTTWGLTASGACTLGVASWALTASGAVATTAASWAVTTTGVAAANGLPFDRVVRAWSTSNVANLFSAPGTTIGGVTMANGETFGLSGQSTPSQNGPWVFNGSGSSATRPTWFDLGAEAVLGMVIRVAEGTNKSTSWQLETTGAITINSTSLTWAKVNGSGGGGSGDSIDDGSGNGLRAFSGSVSAMGTTSFAGSFTSFSPAANTDVQITAAENWTAGAGAGFAVLLSQGDGSSATIAEDVDIVAAGELSLRSGAASAISIQQTGGGGFFMDAGGYLSVESGGSSDLDVIAGAGLNLSAGGAFTLAAGGAVTIGGAGVTKLKPSANVVCSVESANGGSYWAAENSYVSAFTGGNMVFTAAGNVNFDNGGVYGLRGPGPLTISTSGNGRRHQTRWDAPVTPGSSAATNLLTIDCPANRTTCVRREVVVRNGTGNYKVFDLSFAVDCDGSNATASAVTAAVGQSAGTIGTVSSDFTVSVSGLNATLRVANASGYVVTPNLMTTHSDA